VASPLVLFQPFVYIPQAGDQHERSIDCRENPILEYAAGVTEAHCIRVSVCTRRFLVARKTIG